MGGPLLSSALCSEPSALFSQLQETAGSVWEPSPHCGLDPLQTANWNTSFVTFSKGHYPELPVIVQYLKTIVSYVLSGFFFFSKLY